jgi:serine protease inhibitor
MKKIIVCISAVVLLLSCHDESIQPDNPPNLAALSASEQSIANASKDFAFKLFSAVRDPEPENIFISPFSVSTALAMTLNGAGDETRQSILETIDFGDYSADELNAAYRNLSAQLLSMDRTVTLGIANSVWYEDFYTINESFADIIIDSYNGKVQGLNFSPAAVDVINNWVEDKTNGRIKDLISQLSPDDVMVLINAIHFKGEWIYKFDEDRTRKADFFTADGSSVPVDMMHVEKAEIFLSHVHNVQYIDIPYGNGQFSFSIIMPDDPDSIGAVVSGITGEKLNAMISDAQKMTTSVELPKFKMTWKNDIIEDLVELGMKTTGFTRLFEGNVSGSISQVVHQSFLEVNEKGSEAAAATAVVFEVTNAIPQPQPIVIINKPFLFLVREKHTGVILFIGLLNDPSALE